MYSPLQHVCTLHGESCSLEQAHTPCASSRKSQENKPWHREGEVREVIFNEKGELLVANESLFGVCVSKMLLQTFLINTGVVCDLEVS